ncbi:MAG: DEAD/DEAH box helicase family protein [Patescibacteria group bacterium]|nr:DEAD/DEAH box helicase family protein [Patescibacteria group bacterium]
MDQLYQLKHQDGGQSQNLLAHFPWSQYPDIHPNQQEALEIIARHQDEGEPIVLELPTGSGKTAIGYTVLKQAASLGKKPLFYIVPTKTLVDQVKSLHPDLTVVYGRNEYSCCYFTDKELTAEEVPCILLGDCPHRVDQETGQTKVEGVTPCPYLLAKYQAKKAEIVVCTMAFYLFTQLYTQEWEKPKVLVIDEAHRIAQVVRNALSFEITDAHIRTAIKLLQGVDFEEASGLEKFLTAMIRIARTKPSRRPTLLEDEEIKELMGTLLQVNLGGLRRKIGEAVERGKIDTAENMETLRRLEKGVYELGRYLKAFEYSLSTDRRQALNYTYGFYNEELDEGRRVQHKLVIKAYYVGPLIKKLLPSSGLTVAYSATISNAEIFGFETGIKGKFYTFSSDFPVGNARIFIPKDTPDLSVSKRGKGEPEGTLRRIAASCKQLSGKGIRSLVVVVSEAERSTFLRLCEKKGVTAISYGNGVPPKKAATKFKDGEGDVLVGTVANYGEGIDLPRSLAPVIFFLRPAYPSPYDPATIFEEKRFRRQRWSLWLWRAMMDALQVRGRNIRSAEDIGVTIFVSQQFRRFVFGSLPKWLEDAYCSDLAFEDCVNEAIKVLGKEKTSLKV